MKHLLILIVALALPASAQAAPKHKRHQPRGHVAHHQIACTQFGCIPVRRGCYLTHGRTFSGLPSDFDVVVCPEGTLYGIR